MEAPVRYPLYSSLSSRLKDGTDFAIDDHPLRLIVTRHTAKCEHLDENYYGDTCSCPTKVYGPYRDLNAVLETARKIAEGKHPYELNRYLKEYREGAPYAG